MTVITGISDVKKSWVERIKPQPRRMQERAAENWRLFDSASIEWLPVAADSTCSGRLINMFNLKLGIYALFFVYEV
ncbi:hypothetical protein Q6Y56_004779 [Salmonella enterica]|nr:hypothetical protein [Salmonella enterica]ELL0552958.1 hypothetical protein [Salmonella enterica]ELL0821951.1 hypothetical protein [Salmonella enterica]